MFFIFTHVMSRDTHSEPGIHMVPSLEPQRWFASEFVKPRIDRNPREIAPKTVQEYLYDPRPMKQRLMTEKQYTFNNLEKTSQM